MSDIMRYEIRLFGPRRGQSAVINGHEFNNGVSHLIGQPSNVVFALKYLATYGAYAKGTPEYDAALAAEEEADGISNNGSAAGPGTPDAADGEVQPEGSRAAEEGAADGAGPDDPAEGDAGGGSDRDGHGHAGIPEFSEAERWVKPSEPSVAVDSAIEAAVKRLDPDNEDHWNKDGRPKLSAVEESLGRAGVTRSDVEASAPGWGRDQAIEAALSDM